MNDATTILRDWVAQLDAASKDAIALDELMHSDGWWRDLLSLTWDIRNYVGRSAISAELAPEFGRNSPSGFRLCDEGPIEAASDPDQVTGYFRFDTTFGPGRGFVRLMGVDGAARSWRALAVVTQLEGLHDRSERTGANRPLGTSHETVLNRPTWTEQRRRRATFEDADPTVVIIGAGQGGLALAARLEQLSVPTLLIERNARVGDNWRNRYPSLTLHDPVGMDHLPYLPFPSTWPTFTPKDKFANWLEQYAESMELNVWTSSQVAAVQRDDDADCWSIEVTRDNQPARTLRPRHLVFATGINGDPHLPELPGQGEFHGTVMHSSEFDGGWRWSGRRAVVVGAGVSGHDIAQNLHEHGAEVTMVQRSSTYVVRSQTWYSTMLPHYLEGGPRTEDADLLSSSVPFGLAPTLAIEATKAAADVDRDLHQRLEQRGFKLDFGPNGEGLMGKFLRGIEGYYIDVGASELIAQGAIAIRQGVSIERFTPTGLAFSDGSTLSTDVVVLATGYHGILDSVRPLLGDIADRCQPVFGLAPDGEMSGVWRHSGQDGLWFMAGNLQMSRTYSKPLALRIAAVESGIIPASHGYKGPS